MAAPIVLGITIRANGSAQVTGDLDRVRGSINGADSAAKNANRSFAAMARETLGLGSALKGLAAGLSALAIYQSAKELIHLADAMTLLDSRIKIATSSQADYLSSSKELVAISLRTGTSFDANATIFSRINKAMEQMGGTTRNTTALTETLAQSLRISGTSAGEAASVIRQMSQALASGVLRGDEFNSLMENSPRLSQALADGMHVSIGALRAMAEAGELTSKRVITAIQSQSSVINEEFAKIPLTVGAAMENINTAFGQYVLEVNKGSGATAGLAQSVNDLAKNLTPVLDGIITLGKIAVAVFVTQMAGSIATYIATYIAATRGAMAIESAHSAAIVQNAQVNIARAEATIAATASVVAYRAAQVSLSIAEEAAVTSRLALVDTSIAQARATIAATSATVQSTAILYLNRQATQDLAIAQQARVGIITELNVLGRQQTAMATQLTIAEEAQAAATAELAAAQRVATFSLTGFIAGLTLAGVAMAALSAATSIFIGLQLATYLNEFVAVQNAGASAANYLIKTMETLNYVTEKAILLSKLDFDRARQLRVEHEASMASHNEITASIIANNNAKEKGSSLTGEMASALESLKSPQEVYNQKLIDANEAAKTLDATTGKLLITEDQRLALGAKALEIWSQANAEEQNAKLSAAGKEAAKLQDQYDKLTLSPKDYNKQNAQSFAGSPEEIASVERLSNAILTLQESKKALTKDTKEQNSEAKKAATASDTHNKKILELLQSLSSELYVNTLSAKDKALQIALRTNLKDAIGDERVEIELITKQIAAETETRRIQQSMWDETISQANELDKLKDDSRYATELANMAKSLQLQGFSNAAIKEQIELEKQKKAAIEANFYLPKDVVAGYTDTKNSADQQLSALTSQGGNLPAKGSGIIQKETTETARVALEAYNKTLDDAHVKTSDLGAVTSAIFDGALGGINTMAGAFDNMVNSINKSSLALDENAKMQVLNESTVDQAAKASNTAKYAKEESVLNGKILSDKLSGTRQIAGAVSSMLKQGSTEQRVAHAIEMGIAGAQMAQTLIKLLGIGAEAAAHTAAVVPFVAGEMVKGEAAAATGIATQAAAGPYIGFALMAAMAVAMAAIGFGSGGSGASVAPPPATSPDTGTVLGDSTAKSESVNKTYDLLKSIHADEYSELRGINAGIGSLASAITGTITAIFQGGGLVSVPTKNTSGAMGFNSSKQSIAASGINTNAISVSDIMAGSQVSGSQFDTVKTDKSSWWGLSKSTSYNTYFKELDSKVTNSISQVFNGMGASMMQAAKLLGGNLEQSVKDYIIPAMNVDLKDLSGEEAAKKLNGVISTALDTMSIAVFGDIIGQYQKLGEGMLETAVRIVSEVAVVKDALAKSGLSLATNAIAISDALVQAAGGLAEFQKQFSAFFDKFYTDSEKQAASYKSLTSSMLDVLYVLPKTREEYRKYLESLNLNDALDQKRYSMMLKLSDAADSYYTAIDAQTKVYTDAISTAKSNLATAYKTESDAISGTISKLTSFISSLKTLKDSLSLGNLSTGTPLDKYNESRSQLNTTAATISGGAGTTTASKAAYDSAVGGINAKITGFLDASKTYNASGSGYTADYQQIMSLIDSLGISAGSQQTDAEKQLTVLTASVDGLITLNTSVLSVKDAILGLGTASDALTKNATQSALADATAMYNLGVKNLDNALFGTAAGTAAALSDTNKAAVMPDSVAKTAAVAAAAEFTRLAAASAATLPVFYNAVAIYKANMEAANTNYSAASDRLINGSHANGLDFVPFDGYRAELHRGERVLTASQARNSGGNSQEIILELRALREEVAKLRAEQRDSTGALIQSNYDANDQAADKVVAGGKDTAKQSAWVNNSRAVIA